MPGVTVDGNDVLAVYEATGKAVERARAGEGPSLVECKTYRWRGHHEGDPNQGKRYRTMEEIQVWVKKCPIRRFEEKLVSGKVLVQPKVKKIWEDVQREIDESVEYANQSPFPQPEDMYEDVYA
jgi:pyruvate dehydrogenase E1 component alpha subunit